MYFYCIKNTQKIIVSSVIKTMCIMRVCRLFSCAGAVLPLASMTLASAKTDRYMRLFFNYPLPLLSRGLKIQSGTENGTSEKLSGEFFRDKLPVPADDWCWDQLMLQIAPSSRCDAPPCKCVPLETTTGNPVGLTNRAFTFTRIQLNCIIKITNISLKISFSYISFVAVGLWVRG